MITWSGYTWLTSERWGQIHPDKPVCWYDPGCVSIDANNYLHLKTRYNPKHFEDSKIKSNIGIGLVSCTEKFSYGTFEIVAKLPTGKHLWPAFWMWSWDSWPPEIDVFEAYTGDSNNYLKPLLSPLSWWNVQTSLHYRSGTTIATAGAKRHWWGWKNPARNFMSYKLEWTPKSIKFYFNDKLVRLITDSKFVSAFDNTTLNVIINNAVTYDVDVDNPPQSDFIVKSFTYKHLQIL